MKLGPMVSATNAMLVRSVLFAAANTAAIANTTQEAGGSTFSACA